MEQNNCCKMAQFAKKYKYFYCTTGLISFCHTIMFGDQCEQIGRFLKVLGKKIIAKVAQIFGNLFGRFKKHHF